MTGRKRVHIKNLPAHIDPQKIPKGIYWDRTGSGRWVVIKEGVDGKKTRKTVAWRDSSLSELHRITEELNGINRRSLRWLLEEFHKSNKFKELALETKKHYEKYLKIVCQLETKAGLLGGLDYSRMTSALFQRLIDRVAEEGHPTKANHILRYVRRVFSWGKNRGFCLDNPAKGVEQAKERKQHRMPSDEAYQLFLNYAKERNRFVWAAMELAFLCRLRRVEVISLSDANNTPVGIRSNRRKGSLDNITKWTPRLRSAWDEAIRIRDEKFQKSKAPIPIQPENRFIFTNGRGMRLTKDALSSAWWRLIKEAITKGIITKEQAFNVHGLKHRGVTKTPGNRTARREASGHKSEAAFNVYDHSLPVVETPEG